MKLTNHLQLMPRMSGTITLRPLFAFLHGMDREVLTFAFVYYLYNTSQIINFFYFFRYSVVNNYLSFNVLTSFKCQYDNSTNTTLHRYCLSCVLMKNIFK